MKLRPATPADVDTIAGWHPMPRAEVLGWWDVPGVEPWVMVAPDDRLVAYGELWTDEEEDEIELARLIVAPELRSRGLGKDLVRSLTEKAAATGLATTMLRVEPDNATAIHCYLACGFSRLGPEESALWNQGQRREWLWMRLDPQLPVDEHPGVGSPC
jgi:ribosomal protein S18 acetylase RimI-like enzyme